jgi:hypothetical protein
LLIYHFSQLFHHLALWKLLRVFYNCTQQVLTSTSLPLIFLISITKLSLVHVFFSKIEEEEKMDGHVACMGEMRNAYNILDGKPEGRRPL